MLRIASCVSILLYAVSCGQREQAWVVVDMEMPGGEPAQMAFNNPQVPDMTLAECKASLEGAMPTLKAAIAAEPRLSGNRFTSARCVMSVGDPIKPQT